MLNLKTASKLYGLIGFPLNNTRSADLFNEWFRELGLVYEYRNFPISDLIELTKLLLAHPKICGLNVTRPYKQTVIPYLNRLDPNAEMCGAVNCIHKDELGELTGYNTDVEGFSISLLNFLEGKQPESALIFGNGGAARAVKLVLNRINIPFHIVCRNPGPNTNHLDWENLDSGLVRDSQLLINCTPVGMYPDSETLLPIPYEKIGKHHFCYDLIYLPEQTPFLQKAKEAGAKIQNGSEMLRQQAMEAGKIWFPDQIE